MDAAIAGLLGALIGALAGILGAFITHRLQSRAENEKWLTTKKEEAYANTLRYLVRIMNKRTNITSEGTTYIEREFIKEFFDDMSEVQIWLIQLNIYCAVAQRNTLRKVLNEYTGIFEHFRGREAVFGGRREEGMVSIASGPPAVPVVVEVYNTVLKCAQQDLGKLTQE